jgi:hypothetical protein
MIQPDLTFDAEKHEYRWQGKPVPSVTQILGSVYVKRVTGAFPLQFNGKTVFTPIEDIRPIGFDDRFLKDDIAQKFGIAFHKIAAYILRGKEPEYPKSMEPWVEQFRRFLKENPCSY